MPATPSSSSRRQTAVSDDMDESQKAEELEKENSQREHIRKRLRNILERVTKTKRAQLQFSAQNTGYQTTFEAIADEVREIFKNEIAESGDHVRELKLDAVITLELSKISLSYFETLVQSGNKCDINTLFRVLKGNYNVEGDDGNRRHSSSSSRDIDSQGGNFLSYHLLGQAVMGSVFNTNHAIRTMFGPIKQEIKERVQKERKVTEKEDMKKVKTQNAIMQENDGEEDQNDSTAARVKHMIEHVQPILYEGHDEGSAKKKAKDEATSHQLDMLHTLVDPKDPVKTVENFFDFAFLLKVSLLFNCG